MADETKKKTAKKSKKGADKRTPNKEERRLGFMRNFMPYILGAIALFMVVCFIVDLFSRNIDSPAEHGMGVFGYYICHTLFGCLSWVAYLIPAVLATLTVFWQRYFRTGKVISKLILSVLLLLLLASLTHVIACTADADMADVVHPAELFETGAAFESGGVIGGLLGFLLYWAWRLPGTIALTVVTLPLIIMCLVGTSPRAVFDWLMGKIRAAKESRKEAAADKPAKEKAERVSPQPHDGKARSADQDEDEDPDDDADDADGDDGETARVNLKTGEIYESKSEQRKRTGLFGKRKQAAPEETEDEATYASLPLNDPRGPVAPAPDEETTTAAEDDLPWRETPAPAPSPITAYGRRDGFPPDDEPSEENEDDPVDAMEVSFDDEPGSDNEIPTRISGRRVSYEVITDNERTDAAGHRSGEPVSVRILRADPTAVAERGLSDEEIVLPSDSDAVTEIVETREYVFPSIDMLTRGPSQYASNDEEIAENTEILRDVLQSFRIGVREISCSCGPTITRFEVKPDTGVRVRSIANLVDDIAMALAKAGVRIEAPIPGKSAVGIEVPNAEPATVYLRNILETPEFRNHKSRIAACLGADVSGRPVIMDINKMPHLLIAGATGTGKSVCINSLIMSILYKAKPDEVKLILIDPKKVEFAMYRDLPHLYAPVVSDPKKAAGALNSAVNEMERRFELIEEVGVRNLAGYNEITAGDPERPPLPQMVIIIDELADLMMTAPAEVETAICRLAQKARAAGIHLIIGTQRPSVDVITGLIKANVPSRIAFTVKSGVDSRTILDTVGADKLIGRGDMLYAPIGCSKPIRAQGAFVSESEVEKVVTFIKEHNDGPVYNEEFARSIDVEAAKCGNKKKGEQMSLDDFDGIGGGRNDGEDPKFWEALEIAVTKDKIGTSALQRGCNLGYGRAAKIIDRMEELGFVGPDPGTKQGRKVLISKQDLIQYKLNGLPGSESDGESDEE